MFLYNVPPPRNGRLDPPQTVSTVNRQQQQPNHDFQPSYTNIPGRNAEDWPTIDEAGYASLIRRKNSHSNIDQNESDEPLYEKIPENAESRNGYKINSPNASHLITSNGVPN